jgi:hypothetical protein
MPTTLAVIAPPVTSITVTAANNTTTTAAADDDVRAVVLLDDTDAELATVAARDLQPTKALALASDGGGLPRGGVIAVRVCAHFARDGACKRKHRCRFAHYVAGSSWGGAQGRADVRSPAALDSTLRPSAASRTAGPSFGSCASSGSGGGSESGAPPAAAARGNRVYGRRGWSHAAYGAVPLLSPTA